VKFVVRQYTSCSAPLAMKRICAHTTHEGSSNQAMHLAFVEHARCDTAHGRREQSKLRSSIAVLQLAAASMQRRRDKACSIAYSFTASTNRSSSHNRTVAATTTTWQLVVIIIVIIIVVHTLSPFFRVPSMILQNTTTPLYSS
jgi:hypothetical protein